MKILATGLMALCLTAASHAATYPNKPIRMIIPWPAGGYADNLGRHIANDLSTTLGQPIVVENRGGSNGLIGAAAAAKAEPDGYTVMFHSITSHVINPSLYKQVPYDTDALVPVSIVVASPLLLVASSTFEADDIQDTLTLARASKKEPLSVASFGAGSASHLAIELLKQQADIDLLHVPYRGGGPALIDTVAGTVPLYFAAFGVAQPMVEQGRLKPLAVTSRERVGSMPNVPTLAEAALPEFEMSVTYALWAPGGTPAAIQERLAEELQRIVTAPAFQERLAKEGASGPVISMPSESQAFARQEGLRLNKLIESARISLD